jgi:hypothetical protein
MSSMLPACWAASMRRHPEGGPRISRGRTAFITVVLIIPRSRVRVPAAPHALTWILVAVEIVSRVRNVRRCAQCLHTPGDSRCLPARGTSEAAPSAAACATCGVTLRWMSRVIWVAVCPSCSETTLISTPAVKARIAPTGAGHHMARVVQADRQDLVPCDRRSNR